MENKRVVDFEAALESTKTPRPPGYTWERIRASVIERDKGRCTICRRKKASDVDHIIPVALGGTNDLNNLQLLCTECHKKKTTNDQERLRRIEKARKLEERRKHGTTGFI